MLIPPLSSRQIAVYLSALAGCTDSAHPKQAKENERLRRRNLNITKADVITLLN